MRLGEPPVVFALRLQGAAAQAASRFEGLAMLDRLCRLRDVGERDAVGIEALVVAVAREVATLLKDRSGRREMAEDGLEITGRDGVNKCVQGRSPLCQSPSH